MGWSKGLGADLTAKIERFLDATHIFDIQAPVREESSFGPSGLPLPVPAPGPDHRGTYGAYYAHGSMDAPTARMFTLEPVAPYSTTARYTAADMRTLTILSYFHACFPLDVAPGDLQQITAQAWDTSRPLCAVPPYEVDCSVALDKVVLTGAGSEDVVEEEIGRVLNGAIVGLVSCEPGTLDVADEKPGGSSAQPTGIPYTRQYAAPSPASSNCVGLALVRGVSPPVSAEASDGSSPFKTYLHILSPLPHALLARSRVLVKGEIELPVWGMLDFRSAAGNGGTDAADPGDVAGVEREKVPFLQWGRAPDGVIGAEKKRVRRNLMRRGQM
jgi:polynucleotide 5'-hydroxyl-kinase GRC3/NOL9